EDLEAHYLAGLCHASEERLGEAEEHARTLLALAPELPMGHEVLAISVWRTDKRRAEKALYDALKLDPENPTRHAMLGRFLADLGRLEDGITAAHKGLQIKPDHLGSVQALQVLYRLNDEPEMAAAMADKALAIDPEDADAHLEAGLALLGRGQSARARGRFLESLRIAPADGDNHEAIAHERVRNHWLYKDTFMLPVEGGAMWATLATPAFWYALSLLWSPLRFVAYLSLGLIVLSYAHRALFRLSRGWVLRSIRAGKL
ncbi:MAG: tetratricopeptide repeat protein, partial [Myxococcales bacterium]|nr:tetratricopeptide repeat protein [Myxococcales bacterium]